MFKERLTKFRKYLLLLLPLLLGSIAVVIFTDKSNACEGCYVLDKGEFKYIIYDNIPKHTILGLHQSLLANKPHLLKSFNLHAVPKITLRVWANEEAYLLEQENTIGSRYPGSRGYVTLPQGVMAGELRLFKGSHDLNKTALHEFVHLLTLEVNPSFANNPPWLWEAIAIYKSEHQWKYAEAPDLIRSRFDNMLKGLYEGRDTAAIYELGYTIGEYIENTWGQEALVLLIQSNGDFSVLSDKPLKQVFLDWQGFVKEKYFNL
ncbi:hypothetical protein SAMN02745866_01023 [Alteromonadaceae bacterium Bs31]|nr:hypothetical protein SAMN02745866_01023 [Alteromonadaceae bacterium Bs31]